jgi:hypothetical protein
VKTYDFVDIPSFPPLIRDFIIFLHNDTHQARWEASPA